MPYPGFRPHLRVERLAPDQVILLGEHEQYALTGDLYYLLAPLLDGQHTLSEIVEAVTAFASPMQVQYAIERLRARGYVIDYDQPSPPDKMTRFWSQVGRLPTGQASILTTGGLDAELLRALLSEMNILGESAGAAIDLVVTDTYLNPDLALHNRSAVRPWLLAKVTGNMVWVGPIFEPGTTACWECLVDRLRGNQPLETFLEQQRGMPVVPLDSGSPASSLLGLSLTAHETSLWLAGERHLRDQVYTFDLLSLTGEWHRLVRRPNCSVCGSSGLREATPISLHSRPKTANDPAGYRSAAAAHTLALYQHHVSSITGIVNHITRVRSPEHIFIYAAGHNKSRPFSHWQHFRRNLRSQSAGKGTDDIQARTSALCEAIERYSGLFQGNEPRFMAAYAEIPSAVHPHALLGFSEQQYLGRQQWNATCPPHLAVPDPFREDQPIEWSPAWSLRDHTFHSVPTAFCYYDYPLPEDHYFCGSDSNGCAAGSSLEDAILQGILELIERDAVAIWWYNRLCRPAFDLNAIEHPYLTQTRRYFADTGRELWALDLTADLGIPVIAALSRRTGEPTEDIVIGFGAHLDPHIALLRAVTELNQSLPAVLRDEQGRYQSESPWELHWWQTVTIADHAFLAPDRTQPLRTLGDYPITSTVDLREDIQACVRQLAGIGIEVLVVDQTRADADLPVVRVIAPGLRHFWGRFAPGRLYQVPVAMGWLSHPLTEAELNPLPMFL